MGKWEIFLTAISPIVTRFSWKYFIRNIHGRLTGKFEVKFGFLNFSSNFKSTLLS